MTPLTIDQALRIAVEHHRAGRLAEAEAIYRQVLGSQADHADALHLLGLVACETGHVEAAIDLIGRAVALKPDVAEYHGNLGETYRRAGQWDAASASFTRATELNPTHAEAHNLLGQVLWARGCLVEATAAFRRAVELRPSDGAFWNNLGALLHARHELDDAIAAFHQAIVVSPELAEAQINLGNALRAQGRFEQAAAACRRAIALQPDSAEAHGNLGAALLDLGRLDEAVAALRQAIQIMPGLAEAYSNLASALGRLGRLDDATAALQRAAELAPGLAQVHSNLGNVLRASGQLDEAIAACLRGIALDPRLVPAHINLALALSACGRLDEARAALERAIELEPESPVAYNNLGTVHADQGRLDEALTCFRKALELDPGYSGAASNVLTTLYYHPGYDAQAILAEHRRWDAAFARPLAGTQVPHLRDRSPARRLRIGYLSPDFRAHPVGRFVLPLLECHDPEAFEIICYDTACRPDAMTERCRARADLWCEVAGRSDDQVASTIRADRIDILVDLTMHMANGRLLVFARKPAPIQVTYLAYCGTTGLTAMDYRLTDPYLDPPGGDEGCYSEQTIRLPETFWCYQPALETTAPNLPPAGSANPITFGCLNNFGKITNPTLEAWSRLLGALPETRLLLHAQTGSHRERVRDYLHGKGISRDRLTFAGRLSVEAYLELYEQIDIGLDPFPFGGGTTTCDALWMGVPVVTLAGQTAVGRGGLSILSNLGLQELVAHDVSEYVSIAMALAQDRPRLGELRSTLRPRMQSSPLMDAPRFTRGVETAYRAVWRRWCARG